MSGKSKFDGLTKNDWLLMGARSTIAQQAQLVESIKAELAALREELALANRTIQLLHSAGEEVDRITDEVIGDRERLRQCLTAAEERNASLTECLERLRGCSQLRPTSSLIELIDTALKPTESGASE